MIACGHEQSEYLARECVEQPVTNHVFPSWKSLNIVIIASNTKNYTRAKILIEWLSIAYTVCTKSGPSTTWILKK